MRLVQQYTLNNMMQLFVIVYKTTINIKDNQFAAEYYQWAAGLNEPIQYTKRHQLQVHDYLQVQTGCQL